MEFQWDDMDFGRLEKAAFHLALLIVRETLPEILEAIDEYLAATRDKSRYEVAEIEERTIDTLVGPVKFRRRSYKDRQTGERVFLLDQKLNIKGYQRVSDGLVDVAVSLAAAGPSYRNAQDRLEQLIGERALSHEGIRQLLLKTSEAIDKESPPSTPPKRKDVLFIEADGLFAGRQKRGRKKKEEVKYALVHEGWKERYPGSKEHETITTLRYVHPRASGDDFWEGLYRELEKLYDLEDTTVIINGDGASWIKRGLCYFERAIYQYDRFHISREVSRSLSFDKALREEALSALRDNDLGRLKKALEAAIAKASAKDRAKCRETLKTILSNWEHIIDYRIRLRALGHDCTGLRGLGSGESNIGKLKSRIRGRSWSTRGLEALGNVLFKLLDGSLGLYTSRVQSRAAERLKNAVSAGAKAVKRAILATGSAGVKRGRFPALDRGTEGYAELFRQILREGFVL